MQIEDTNFGLSGLPGDEYDSFLGLGKKGKRRRKARRARRKERRKIRTNRRKLKNEERRANIEAQRAQTRIMTATMAPTPTRSSSTRRQAAANPASSAAAVNQSGVPMTQKAGFGGNTMIIIGVLVIGGFLFMNKQQQPANPNVMPPAPPAQ